MSNKTDYDKNVDYKKMYLTMMNAVERAMEMLIEAQRTCEELYINPNFEEKNQP